MDKLLLICLVGFCYIFSASAQRPWEPAPRLEGWWIEKHNQFVQTTITNGSNIEIVFIGSSSIEIWGSTGRFIWDPKYAPLGSVNYGIGGDQIENCLWRIMNGEVLNLNPKMLVLYCGSNNIWNPATADIVRGITTTLNEISTRLPNTKILYLNINPRADMTPVVEIFNRTVTINQEVMRVHHGNNKTVVFDMFDDYILSWGQINPNLYEGDKIHFNRAGYELWDNLWNSTFFDTLNGN